MRRLIAFLLMVSMLAVCMSGIAESQDRIVTVNLDTATDEELAEAADQIKAEQKARLKTTIQLDVSEVTLNKGSSRKVNAVVMDLAEGVKAGRFTWTTSDKAVATCENGMIKIAGPGEATVTCSCVLSDGTEISADIAVTGLQPVQSISLGSAKMDVMAGDVFKPEVIVKPENASNQNVVLSSSDEKVVRVDESGQLVAVMEGRATVTVTTADGSNKTTKLNVNVIKKVGKYDDELTFQGVKWGIDCSTAYNELAKNGFVEERDRIRAYNSGNIYFWPENDLYFATSKLWRDLPVVFADKSTGAAYLSITPQKTVGGYAPQQITLYFLNGITAEGTVDPETTEFSSVYIRYDNKHEPGAEIFLNLLTKLEAQYGEFTRYISKQFSGYSTYKDVYDVIKNAMKGAKQYGSRELGRDIYMSVCAICTLKGKNNTGIMLMVDYSGYVTLFYGKTDMPERIRAIQEILESEPDGKDDAGI